MKWVGQLLFLQSLAIDGLVASSITQNFTIGYVFIALFVFTYFTMPVNGIVVRS